MSLGSPLSLSRITAHSSGVETAIVGSFGGDWV